MSPRKARVSGASLATLALVVACAHRAPHDVEPPSAGGTDCRAFCERLRTLGCPGGSASPRLGITCETRCERASAMPDLAPPIACVVRAMEPSQVVACGERCSM